MRRTRAVGLFVLLVVVVLGALRLRSPRADAARFRWVVDGTGAALATDSQLAIRRAIEAAASNQVDAMRSAMSDAVGLFLGSAAADADAGRPSKPLAEEHSAAATEDEDEGDESTAPQPAAPQLRLRPTADASSPRATAAAMSTARVRVADLPALIPPPPPPVPPPPPPASPSSSSSHAPAVTVSGRALGGGDSGGMAGTAASGGAMQRVLGPSPALHRLPKQEGGEYGAMSG